MRHILRGALGVAVVYPLLWHYSSADVGGVPSTAAVAASERRGTERSPSDRSGVDQPLRAERAPGAVSGQFGVRFVANIHP